MISQTFRNQLSEAHGPILIKNEQAHMRMGGAGPCEEVDIVPLSISKYNQEP